MGTGFGATACVLADALRSINGQPLKTIDVLRPEPVNVDQVAAHVDVADWVHPIVEPLGYNWVLADWLSARPVPEFDLCLLDGAHEWEPDGLAFTLAAEVLSAGGWIVIDDLNFRLRDMPTWQLSHGHLTDRELDTEQMAMVYNLLVSQRSDFSNFRITHGGRVGWARKRRVFTIRLP
jgi:predicted O-methyltransferase YrrM